MRKRKGIFIKRKSVRNGILRLIFTIIAISLEVGLIVSLLTRFNSAVAWISMGTRLLAIVLVLAIYSQHITATMKMPWIMIILVTPIFGTTMYLLIGLNSHVIRMKKRYDEVDRKLFPKLHQSDAVMEKLREFSPQAAGLSTYLARHSFYPVCQNTDVEYFDEAFRAFASQKEALEEAKHFIFLEYYAIEDRESWHDIQDILERKVREGVEVRVIYDDLGSIGFITTDFVRRMEAVGIRCRVFNPFAPGLNAFLNNRDHRKFTVIDGLVGYTGGYNLANEYFNITHPYGHWKDTGVKITGDAVRNMTVTFLEMWNAVRADDEDDQTFDAFLPRIDYRARERYAFVQPYADSPMDDEQVGENVYISIANSAEHYAWFSTPYLIITDEMIHALGLAAKRGVDVRIITPGIPDKKLVYSVTRSYYNSLTRNGVKIYEYTPGFCHAKMAVSDDKVAVCGTINLDYRSLYHHFENGCLYMNCRAVHDTKADFDATLSSSRNVTAQYTVGRSRVLRFGQLILRLAAPLL